MKTIFNTLKLLLLITILFSVVILMVNNREFLVIRTFPLPFEFEARVFIVMLFFFLFGFIFGRITKSKQLFSLKSRKKKKIDKKKKRR